MKAMVVGGFAKQITGSWGKLMREHLGIEVGYACGSDNEFRGLPTDDLPADVEMVLIVVESVSHRASDQAKWLANKKGVRCEMASINATRTVEMLRKRGYVKPAPEVVYKPTAAPQVLPPAPEPVPEATPATVEWLDATQARELLPTMGATMFYDLVKQVVKRPPHKEPRMVTRHAANGRAYTFKQPVMVWTMDEVAAIEAAYHKRVVEPPKTAPVPEPEPPKVVVRGTPFRPLSEAPPVVFTNAIFSVAPEPAPEPAPTQFRDYREEMLTLLDEYAHSKTRNLRGMLDKVVAERDSLRQQLAKIRAALG